MCAQAGGVWKHPVKGNSGDNPRAGASQNDETPSSQSHVPHPRKTKRTPVKQWQSTAHAPLGGEQGDPTVRSVAALLTTYRLKIGETPPDNGYARQP